MKIWTPSLLLSRTPPSSSARVLNGQQNLTSFSENKLNPFNFILMYKKIGKLRLKDNCGCFGKNLLMKNPFKTLSFSGRFLAPSILLHFSSFDKSLILSSRRTWVSLSWIYSEKGNNAKNSVFGYEIIFRKVFMKAFAKFMKEETFGTSLMITPPFGFPGTPVLLLLLVITALIEK